MYVWSNILVRNLNSWFQSIRYYKILILFNCVLQIKDGYWNVQNFTFWDRKPKNKSVLYWDDHKLLLWLFKDIFVKLNNL